MVWIFKAILQNTISLLPNSIANSLYYTIQCRFGGLKHTSPESRILAAKKICEYIVQNGGCISEKKFLEVGSGRSLVVPLYLWLMGASKIVTVDLNRYLKVEIFLKDIKYITSNLNNPEFFSHDILCSDRFNQLFQLNVSDLSIKAIKDIFSIDYIAPGDATNLSVDDNYFDYHISYTVFEHIPPIILKNLLSEAKRVVKNGSLCIHCIDYTDHFAHSDSQISLINFYKYSDLIWKLLAGNQFMYQNRIRHSEIIDLYASAQHEIVDADCDVDAGLLELINTGLIRLNNKFRKLEPTDLATVTAWVISRV